MTNLNTGELQLPADTVTSTIVVYGGKGMGKTNLGGVIAEELHRHGDRFSVFDPLDVWYGLQYGANRQTAGLDDLVILGGPHGDFEIDPRAGELVADFVIDERGVSTIVVLRRAGGEFWTPQERITFATAYFSRLFQRAGERKHPLMQIIDEAGRFVPQMAAKGDRDIAACIAAIEQLVEWGRNFALGTTLITQRSARMAKSVSELAEIMFAFRTIGPNSVGAIVDWFGEHVETKRQHELVAQLRSLPVGSALVVAPALHVEAVCKVRMRETFDSSKTPKSGGTVRATGRAGRKPDIAKYRERMAKTIELAKENDAGALKKELARLREQLRKEQFIHAQSVAKPAAIARPKQKAVVVVKHDLAKRQMQAVLDKLDKMGMSIVTLDVVSNTASGIRADLQSEIAHLDKVIKEANTLTAREIGGAALANVEHGPPSPRFMEMREQNAGNGAHKTRISSAGFLDPEYAAKHPSGSSELSDGPQRILNAIAYVKRIGGELGARRIATLAGLSSSSSTWRAYCSALRKRGLMSPSGLDLTDAGGAAAHAEDQPATNAAAHAQAHERLGRGKNAGGARRMLDVLLEAFPRPRAKDELAAGIGVSPTSSTYRAYFAALNRQGFITKVGSGYAAAELLFPEGVKT